MRMIFMTNVSCHLQGAKEQVKDLMKDIANEAVKKGEEVIQEVKEVAKTKEEGEQTTPTKENGIAVDENKKKVQKKRSFRRFSFLRKEKKAKEDKQKNGEVTSPEVCTFFKH